jgi:hypothetical protein
MAVKGETGAASAAPAEKHSDADNKAARAMMDPDILMTSVSVRNQRRNAERVHRFPSRRRHLVNI